MQLNGKNLLTHEKLTVLTFDEVYLSNKVDLERREQQICGPHRTCQVMARGLFNKWKQPIYYDYSKSMIKDILFEIMQALYDIGYIVSATTCDMGCTNVSLWNKLNIGIGKSDAKQNEGKDCTEKQCFITHPSDDTLKIFMFADVPHLLKLIRNNFLDHGFIVDGEKIDKCLLEELIHLNSNELKIAFNLTKTHLDVKGFQRQRVKLAAQMFSFRTAMALEYCGKKGFFSKENW